MPSNLIYREDAKDFARHAMAKGLNVLEYLDEVPAADFRPVVHGKWKVYNNTYICSSCGQPVSFWQSNFCPNCGADMRETNDEKA